MIAEWQRRTTRSCTTAFGDPAGSLGSMRAACSMLVAVQTELPVSFSFSFVSFEEFIVIS